MTREERVMTEEEWDKDISKIERDAYCIQCKAFFTNKLKDDTNGHRIVFSYKAYISVMVMLRLKGEI